MADCPPNCLFHREQDLDSRIRAFKTSDPMVRLTKDQLHLLVEECTRLQELHKQRCADVEQQQQQQRQQQSLGGGKSGASEAPRRSSKVSSAGGGSKGSHPPSAARSRPAEGSRASRPPSSGGGSGSGIRGPG